MQLRLVTLITFFLVANPATALSDEELGQCPLDPQCRPMARAAEHAFASHDFEEALRLYQEALTRVPDPRILRNIGRTLFKLGRYSEAVSYYKRSELASYDPRLAERLRQDLAEVQAAMDSAALALKRPVTQSEVERGHAAQADGPHPHPRWRLGLGGAMSGVGLGILLIGISGLAIDGHCKEPDQAVGNCSPYYNTGPTGGVLLGAGTALSVAGVVLMAVPQRRQ